MIDHNNTNDIATPKIKILKEVYHVDTFKEINHDSILVTDDKNDFTIMHEVYKEIIDKKEKICQCWIKYTVTDKSGKVSSKTQRISFNEEPTEKEILPFKDIGKK